MSTSVQYRLFLCFATVVAGCSGSSGGVTPVAPSSVASLSLALEGAPSLTLAEPSATYPVVLHANRSDGSLIVGNYAQQVVIRLFA
jgi:hypothetical protein